LTRDKRASVAVTSGVGEPPAWVTVEGAATVETGGADLARRLAPLYDGEEFAAMALARLEGDPDGLCLITITPSHISHW
jgi:hypothetical protein